MLCPNVMTIHEDIMPQLKEELEQLKLSLSAKSAPADQFTPKKRKK